MEEIPKEEQKPIDILMSGKFDPVFKKNMESLIDQLSTPDNSGLWMKTIDAMAEEISKNLTKEDLEFFIVTDNFKKAQEAFYNNFLKTINSKAKEGKDADKALYQMTLPRLYFDAAFASALINKILPHDIHSEADETEADTCKIFFSGTSSTGERIEDIFKDIPGEQPDKTDIQTAEELHKKDEEKNRSPENRGNF